MAKMFEDQEFVTICAWWNGYAICLDADENIFVIPYDEEYAEEGETVIKDNTTPVTALSPEDEATVRKIIADIPRGMLDAIMMAFPLDEL